jgi:uncharacterized protein (TIGR03000 family)
VPANAGHHGITNHQANTHHSTNGSRPGHGNTLHHNATFRHDNNAFHHNKFDHFHHFNHFHHRDLAAGFFPWLYWPFYFPGFYPFYDYPYYAYPTYYSDLYPDYATPGYASFYNYPVTSSYLDTTVRLPEEYAPPMPPADANAAAADTTAQLTVRVPADADIWIDGEVTQQTGAVRKFVSPPLSPGEYTYQVRARWMQDGRQVVQTRRIPVSPGERRTVDFMQPEADPIAPPKVK